MALALIFLEMVENDLLTKESRSQWAQEMLEDSRFLFADSSHADPKVRFDASLEGYTERSDLCLVFNRCGSSHTTIRSFSRFLLRVT